MTPSFSTDIALVGAGVMSATLGVILHQLQPDWSIDLFERLDRAAGESSDAWNNAGTGHAAYCELNYTPQKPDGRVDCSKAFRINEQFELSKEFWAFAVEKGILPHPAAFIHSIPHISFVRNGDVDFLKKRHETLVQNHLFKGLEYSEDPSELRDWMPLIMDARDGEERLAATRMAHGTDVDFGALTRGLLSYLDKRDGTRVHLSHEVRDVRREPDTGRWRLQVYDRAGERTVEVSAKFVFLGAGGGALDLLDKSDIPEAEGYGGFPVGGQWLVCRNPAVIERHNAKVYGKAETGTPPMSMPHLDTRVIEGQKTLLFGPFAGFSTKFLKEGSYFDLIKSIDIHNIIPMIQAGIANLPLTQYLIGQVLQSPEQRMEALRKFYPSADMNDWELKPAGQRVQVIKKDPEKGGVLEFGTEVVHALDGSLASLLGASPGASTAVAVVLEILSECFAKPMKTEKWRKTLLEITPSYGRSLSDDVLLFHRVRSRSREVLGV